MMQVHRSDLWIAMMTCAVIILAVLMIRLTDSHVQRVGNLRIAGIIPSGNHEGADMKVLASESLPGKVVPSPDTHVIRFIENRGQVVDMDGNPRSEIRYMVDVQGVRLFFIPSGFSCVFMRSGRTPRPVSEATGRIIEKNASDIASHVTSYRLDMELLGTNPNVTMHAVQELPGYTNYYLAHCPDGITFVKGYSRIIYEEIYQHIDLVFSSLRGRLKSHFLVRPGGKVSDIRYRFNGAIDQHIQSDGSRIVCTPLGQLREDAPLAWIAGGGDVPVRSMNLGAKHGYAAGTYDISRTLVLDPWFTFIGGTNHEGANLFDHEADSDNSGNIVFGSYTSSFNYPALNAYQASMAGGTYDAVVTKLSNTGQLLWSTYYGGSESEAVAGIAIDAVGNVYAAGYTDSQNFPLQTPLQSAYGGGRDAFLIKLMTNGTLSYATFYGGSATESARDVCVDGSGAVYFTGQTRSVDFPIRTAYQSQNNGQLDMFIVKLSPQLTLVWATYLGGNGDDHCEQICATSTGTVVGAGHSTSSDFPVLHALQATLGAQRNGMLAEFDTTGALLWATYVGGSAENRLYSVTVDQSNMPVASGWGALYPSWIVNPFQVQNAGGLDAILLKFGQYSPSFTQNRPLLWSTHLGGSSDDRAHNLITDANANIYITGSTQSMDFPVQQAHQLQFAGNIDAFLAKFTPNGQRIWATYLGSSTKEVGWAVEVNGSSSVTMFGVTESAGIGTGLTPLRAYAGDWDFFLMNFLPNGYIPVELTAFTATVGHSSVCIRWRTESELNNHGFRIERRSLRTNWEVRGFAPGEGNSGQSREYSFLDPLPGTAPPGGILFYRLCQIDNDGSENFSDILEARLECVPSGFSISNIHPQPVVHDARLSLSIVQEGPVLIELFDHVGRAIARWDYGILDEGMHILPLDLHAVAPGTYLLRVTVGKVRLVRKVQVVR